MTERMGPDDVSRWLTANQVPFTMHVGLPRVHTVAEAAAALGVAADAIAKTVVFDHGGVPVAVLAPGTHKVRDRLVVAHLGGTRNALRLATPAQVLDWTGFPVGGVPPAGHRTTKRYLVDEALLSRDEVVFGGGADDALVQLDPNRLQAALQGAPGTFSESR